MPKPMRLLPKQVKKGAAAAKARAAAANSPGGAVPGGKPVAPAPSPLLGLEPSLQSLGKLMEHHGAPLDGKVLAQLWRYHQALRRANHDLDLTRLIGFETMVTRHYVDCMILDRHLGMAWPEPLLDIGTGAGFPGLMIKLQHPDLEMVLCEPRPRRVAFLESVIADLGLKKIRVFGHKGTSQSLIFPVAGVVSRAFELVGKTLPRLNNALPKGGQVIFMKGPNADPELTGPGLEGYKQTKRVNYRIPNTTLDRVLVVYKRESKPNSPVAG